MILIIRQPTNVYPSLGNAADGSLSTNKFSFTFSGDKLYSYKITILNAVTGATVYTGSTVTKELYNGELFEHTMSNTAFTNGLDLIWRARLTQATSDMKIVSSTCQIGSSTTVINIRPNSAIKAGMNVVIGAETKAISDFKNYLSKSNSTLAAGSTYNVIKIATGLTATNVVQYTLMIGTQKRTIISYDTATGNATVSPAFTSLYPVSTAYIIADENVAVATTGAFTPAPALGAQYTVYSSFIDTPNYFFKSRTTPTLITNSVFTGLTLSGTTIGDYVVDIMPGLDMFGATPGTFEGKLFITGYPDINSPDNDGAWTPGDYDAVTGVFTSGVSAFDTMASGIAYTVWAGMDTVLNSRIGSFVGTYVQAQGTGIKYHIFNLYDESNVLLDTTGQVYNGLLEYEYDAFVSGLDYLIELIVMNQENVEVTTGLKTFSVSYGTLDFNAKPTLVNLEASNAIQVSWTEDKQAIGTPSGTVSYETDFPFVGTNSVHIETGDVVFDEISNIPIDISLTSHTIFTSINTPITKNGRLISLDDNFISGFGYDYIVLLIENFKLYNEVLVDGGWVYHKNEIVLDTPIPILSGQTVTGTPTTGTGYIWDDSDTWDDTKYWTETDPTDAMQLKVTMLPPWDIQVEQVVAP